MVRQCPACGLESPAERARCYNCNASLEREAVRASRNSEAPTEKRPRPQTNLWSKEFNAPERTEPAPAPPADAADAAVQGQRPPTGRLVRGPMAAEAESLQPHRRAGRGSSGDPSEIAPARGRTEPGTGQYRLQRGGEPGSGTHRIRPEVGSATTRKEPGTGQYATGATRDRHSPWDPLRPPAPPPAPIPEGPLLEPKPRGKTDVFGPGETAEPAAAPPADEAAVRACAIANEAAKGRKRLSPEEVAEYAQALDDFVGPSASAIAANAPGTGTSAGAAAGAPAGAPHYLVTQVLGEPVELNAQTGCKIGRSEENDIVFPLTQVSRVHSEVRWDPTAAAYVVIDKNSINGTFVNGKPVKRRRLADGDRIGVGPFTIVYRIANGTAKVRAGDETDVVRSGALAGELTEMPIGDVVRFIEALRKTGELTLMGAAGERGTIFFRDGQPVHAEFKVQLGAGAAIAMLRMKGGTFRFAAKAIDVMKATISAPLSALIAEAAAITG